MKASAITKSTSFRLKMFSSTQRKKQDDQSKLTKSKPKSDVRCNVAGKASDPVNDENVQNSSKQRQKRGGYKKQATRNSTEKYKKNDRSSDGDIPLSIVPLHHEDSSSSTKTSSTEGEVNISSSAADLVNPLLPRDDTTNEVKQRVVCGDLNDSLEVFLFEDEAQAANFLYTPPVEQITDSSGHNVKAAKLFYKSSVERIAHSSGRRVKAVVGSLIAMLDQDMTTDEARGEQKQCSNELKVAETTPDKEAILKDLERGLRSKRCLHAARGPNDGSELVFTMSSSSHETENGSRLGVGSQSEGNQEEYDDGNSSCFDESDFETIALDVDENEQKEELAKHLIHGHPNAAKNSIDYCMIGCLLDEEFDDSSSACRTEEDDDTKDDEVQNMETKCSLRR